MKRNSYLLPLLFVALITFTGCSNSGTLIATSSTQVELSEGNYSIVASNLSGSSKAASAIGISTSFGIKTDVIGLIPLKGSNQLYKDARQALWDAFEEEHGSVEGRTLALVNVQFDSRLTNLFFYTAAELTMTADVIEFE